MYTYITKELPETVQNYFPVSQTLRSISGHSMGGHGALMIAARNPAMYKSVSAFAPVCSFSTSEISEMARKYFFNFDKELIRRYDATAQVYSVKQMPPGIVDFGTLDQLYDVLEPHTMEKALKQHPNV